MTVGSFSHEPVLAQEVLDFLRPVPGSIVLDGTVGGGGHAHLILEATAPDGMLVGLDRDREALAAAAANLAAYGDRFILRQGNFAHLGRHLAELAIDSVDGILLDVGVSSHQLDRAERGFSLKADGPLDMRMDPTSGESAADLLATAEADQLKRIFRDYGEERWAGRIAREIVRTRQGQPLTTTLQLAELVSRLVPRGRGPQRIHPATRVFQALRIHVNRELEALAAGLQAGLEHLKPGGRMVVISFHSLEDRLVKQGFRDAATGCTCPPRLALCVCGQKPRVKLLTRRAVRAGSQEVDRNPRSRSAVLRAIEKLPEPEGQEV